MDFEARTRVARRRTGVIGLVVLALVATLTSWVVGPVAPAGAATLDVAVVNVSDGTAPFKDAGTVGVHDPGDDANGNNGIVRTLDPVTLRVDYSLNDPDDSNPVLTLTLPPGVAFTDGYTPPIGPGGCDGPGGFHFNADRTVLTCDLGVFPTGANSETIALLVSVTASTDFPNGDSFQMSAHLADGVGTPSDATSTPIEVSSSPRYNLFKDNSFSTGGVGGENAAFKSVEPSTELNGEPGFLMNAAVGIQGDGGDARGLSALNEPITFQDIVGIPGAPAGVGIVLAQCGNSSGSGNGWPANLAPNTAITLPDRQVHRPTIACSQPGGEGAPINVTFTDVDWDRTAPAPIRAANGGSAIVPGIIAYGFVQVFISFEDWITLGHALGQVSQQQSSGNPPQEVGTVTFADRLHGEGAPPASVGTCNQGGSSLAWIPPANVDTTDPSTFDPEGPGGASNLGPAVETAVDNGACFRRTMQLLDPVVIPQPGPSSINDTDWRKFGIVLDTRFGPAVNPTAQITTGVRNYIQAVFRNPDDIRNQPEGFGYAAGSMMCDAWDNSRFGPDPALGEEWLEPRHGNDPEADFTAEYSEGAGWHYEYGRGDWGTHNPDRANAYYKQGRTACDDLPNYASGTADRPTYILPLVDGGSDYWATEDEVDFTNGGGGVIDIDDVNVVRIVFDVPQYPMLPSRRAELTDAQIDAVTTANVIVASSDFQIQLHWRNRAGLVAPIEMRNYSNRRLGPVSTGVLTWASPRARGFSDATQTAPIDPPCGAPCGQQAFIGSENYSLWWQILGPDANVAKDNLTPSPVAPGADVQWRLRAAGEAPLGTPANTPGFTPDVTIVDVLPEGLTYVPGSTTSFGTGVTEGEPEVLPNTPAAGQTTLRWVVPQLPWGALGATGTNPWEVHFHTTTSPFLSNHRYTNGMGATSSSFDGNRGSSDFVDTSQAAAIGVLNKSVTPQQLVRDQQFTYHLQYGNPGTLPFNTFDAIDILPWNQDQAHDRRSHFQNGAIQLQDVIASSRGEVAWVSTTPPAVLDAADSGTADDFDGFLDPADADALGSAQWPCTWADTEAGAPGCPAIGAVTALRFVGSGTPFLAANTGPFEIDIQYTTTQIADPGDVFDNSWSARFGDLTFPVYRPIPLPPEMLVPPYALGNQLWLDSNSDGHRDPGEPAVPAGVVVNLLNAAGDTVLATTTTDANGLYVFDDLEAGTYRVEVDAANFAPGGPLAGLASSPGQSNTDGSDNDDNGAPVGSGAVRSGPVTLGGDADEPLGEDPTSTTAAADRNADLTVDFGFVRGIRIGNLVWNDTDDDGIAEPGETGISGVTVQLIRDDGDGVFEPGIDAIVATTITSASGAYWFSNVESGNYFIAVPGGQSALAGRRSSTGQTGGLTTDNRDDGAPVGTYASATGLLAIDATADQPTGEAGPDGVANDEDEANAGTSTIGDSRSNLTFDLGFFEMFAVGNQVWRDANDNGVRDTGEQPIAGVTVNLLDGNGNLLRTTTTDANGLYVFDGLPAGTYIVEIPSSNFAVNAPLRGWRSSTGQTNTDGTDNNDNGAPVTDPGPNPFPTVAVRSGPVVLGGTGGAEPTGETPTSTTQAADDHADLTVDFGFRPEPITACRGSGLRLGTLTLAVANEPIRACLSVDPAFPSGLNFGSIPIPGVVGGLLKPLLGANVLAFNGDGFHAVSYRQIDRTAADSDVVRLAIGLPGLSLNINTIRSESSATLGANCSRTFGGFSRIGSVSLNGLPLLAGTTAPVTVPLGIATLYLNQTEVQGDTIIHRAVFLDLPGTAADLTAGESIAGISCRP